MKLTLTAALVALTLDQTSKWAILQRLDGQPFTLIDIAAPWLSFGLLKNTGMNFGLLSNYPGFIYAVTLAIAFGAAAGLIVWSRQMQHPFAKVIAGCIAGGAIGNALDRIIHGGVIDFINVSTPMFQNPFLFNVADIFVVGGVATMISILQTAGSRRATETAA